MSNTTLQGYTKTDRSGAIAVVAGASVWGLFWIPLRYLDSLGVGPLWALTLVMFAALLPAVILASKRGVIVDLKQLDSWRAGLAMGIATTLYFVALVYADVIRVIFLFYLLPVWTTITARLIYGEPISVGRMVVMSLALLGLWLLLDTNNGLPLPASIGDWCAIASGFCWGVSLSLLRGDTRGSALSRALVSIGSAAALSLLAAVLVHSLALDKASIVSTSIYRWHLVLIAVIAITFGVLGVFPSMLAQIWGARRLAAPTAALLTMSEIVVAIGSAAWLIGTDLTPMALLGGSIIIVALCADIALQFAQSQNAPLP